MLNLCMYNVGDGLCLHIDNFPGRLNVDFGGTQNHLKCIPLCGSFLLSHFHLDHYNGFLVINQFPCCYLDALYHPRMPQFKQRSEFMSALLAINSRLSSLDPIQVSIINIIKRINKRKLIVKEVGEGDSITCANRTYEILWPPQVLHEEDTLKAIKDAINDFNKALEADPRLQEIYEQLKSEKGQNDKPVEEAFQQSLKQMENVPEIVQKANRSLRAAANRLSIVFRQEDSLLFLGDLESSEIKKVIQRLIHQEKTSYEIVVAAHHGTHWHESLQSIDTEICLCSVGKKLSGNVEPKYRKICNKFIRTDDWGDIRLDYERRIH